MMNITTTPVVKRIRTSSTSSRTSESPDRAKYIKRYDQMTIDELIVATLNTDTDVFENTRQFNPRKQRSCHRRSEPVSEERRKEESSKNSREYTKRNRDEIKMCQTLFADIDAKKTRFEELLGELKGNVQERNIITAVNDFEDIMRRYCHVGSDVRKFCKVPNPEEFLPEFRVNAAKAEGLVFRTGIVSYEQKLEDLNEQYETLYNTKDSLMTQKDRTNFASSKSRLKQRIVRAQLKTDCWKCWQAIETMRMKAIDLKKYGDVLKEKVWNQILAVYYNMIKFVKPILIDRVDAIRIDQIIRYFSPYSLNTGDFSVRWVPAIKKELNEQSVSPVLPSPTESKPDKDQLLSSFQITTPPLPSPSFTLALPTVPANQTPSNNTVLEQFTNVSPPILSALWPMVDTEDKPPTLVAEEPMANFSRKRSADADDKPAKRMQLSSVQELLVPKMEASENHYELPLAKSDVGIGNMLSTFPFNMYSTLGATNPNSTAAAYMSLLNLLPLTPEAMPAHQLPQQLNDALNHQRLIQMLLNSAFQNQTQ